MHTLSLEDLLTHPSTYLDLAHTGAVFIYPTDTIYGLWAIVTPETIQRIDTIKQRQSGKHYSIIAPDVAWIVNHFDVSPTFAQERDQWKQDFPTRGLTCVLPLREAFHNSSPLALLSPTFTVGVRLLDHPFQQFVHNLQSPFITTSCNISGEAPITSISNIPSELSEHVEVIIDGWDLRGQPSVVIEYQTKKILRA